MKYTIELTENQANQINYIMIGINASWGYASAPKLKMNIPLPMKESPAYKKGYEDGAKNQDEVQYKKGFEDGNKIADKDLKEIQDSTYDVAYNEALKDVNHAMDVLENMTETEREEWFEDYASVGEVVRECTMQRIMVSTKDYEEKKKAEKEIRVGDEVICNCPNEQKVIITAKYDGWVTFMRKDGACYSRADTDMKKTGRHFDEVEQLLDKLRGDSND